MSKNECYIFIKKKVKEKMSAKKKKVIYKKKRKRVGKMSDKKEGKKVIKEIKGRIDNIIRFL